ncbi:MAG TPA: ComF family protein [Candidatus Dormibacteraeota bacterium]|nr:ComF family protein [Candidatus Dormibacteraeota bacterium]
MIQALLQIISPPECLECNREGALICQNCRTYIVVKKTPTCFRCNKLSALGRTCKTCRSSANLSGVVVASHYEGTVKKLIGLLKYERNRDAAEVLAVAMTPHVPAAGFDFITSVPIAASRYRQRGYNQAELLAKALSIHMGVPYCPTMIRLGSKQQVGARRNDRLSQIKDTIVVNNPLPQKKVLVVDDVLTTGATLNECARVLKSAGAKTVWGAVAAKH